MTERVLDISQDGEFSVLSYKTQSYVPVRHWSGPILMVSSASYQLRCISTTSSPYALRTAASLTDCIYVLFQLLPVVLTTLDSFQNDDGPPGPESPYIYGLYKHLTEDLSTSLVLTVQI